MTVTTGSCLEQGRLSNEGLEAEVLLAHVLGVDRTSIFAHPERELTSSELSQFQELWGRHLRGEPVAYLTHSKEFFGLDFYVDDRVLIPRPETEHLVEEILELITKEDVKSIWDVGTGSGAIALAIASAVGDDVVVRGSDVSEGAVEVARLNTERLGLDGVKFEVADLLEGVDWSDVGILVANLPYIGREKFHFVEKNVEDYEPDVALFGGKDGLDLYRKFFDQINCSKSNRLRFILGEFGFLQREPLEVLIGEKFPHAEVRFKTDLAGLDRYFTIAL